MARADTNDKLKTYRAKRDFTKTAEPSGKRRVARSKRLRFIVQKHAATRLHYDFRLELDGVLKSWAVTRGPSLDPHDKRLAVETEDHPLDYGDFEGTIPEAEYGGGTVQMWDRGFWDFEGPRATPQESLAKGEIKFTLHGAKMKGSWTLVRMRRREHEKRDNWLLIKHRDAYAVDDHGDAILKDDRSVASGRALGEIAAGKGKKPKPFMLAKKGAADAVWHSDRKEPGLKKKAAPKQKEERLSGKPVDAMPAFVEPELARLVDRPPSGPSWGHEIKLDGYRMQMRVEQGKVTLRTRKGLDWTNKFTAIANDGACLPDCIIDGEIVSMRKDGVPSFSDLQAAIAEGNTGGLLYFVFDLMFVAGEDWRHLPLRARKARLEETLAKAGKHLRYLDHVDGQGGAVFEAAGKMGLEGIVSKQLDSPYRSGRVATWAKSKIRGGQEIVIGGWTEEAGRFRSILAGAYKGRKLEYLGKVGTGFNRRNLPSLLAALKEAASATNPFSSPDAAKEKGVRWATPKLVAEVETAGFSADGILRQTAFKGLREDKDAKDVVLEMPSRGPARSPTLKSPAILRSQANAQVRGVTISHPDKALWPKEGITKKQLAEYYEEVGEHIMDYIAGRPCSIIRAPEGITHELFFQRHANKGSSKLMTFVKVSGEKEPYLQLDTVDALIAAAQIAAVELHPWNCQPDDPETPGRFVFDLDPAPDVPFAKVVEAAKELHERLEKIGLAAFCKTTGGKGLHVVTPLSRSKHELRWPEAKAFTQEVCRQMAADSPDKYLINMAKKERGGRIFLDYLRNDRTSTAVAVCSPRARAGAPISMPITWSQATAKLDPAKYTLKTAAKLIAKWPWKDYEKAARPFAAAAKALAKAR
ncbi:MAG: DNA ligase D [Alphaproteobacteria bacterium]|nr:DNA ligase D [Alphaproteobacteria bacterium]